MHSNVAALKEGADLIGLLQGDQYTQGYKPAFQSTIGAHFRHVLEHYRCFVSQLADGLLCYDKRERDQQLECDADYALRTINELIEKIASLSAEDATQSLLIEDEQTSTPAFTSLNRELLFLQSHTVHHYAIIGAMTRAFGNQPDAEFGVAIATRVHQQSCEDNTMSLVETRDQENQATATDFTVEGAVCAR